MNQLPARRRWETELLLLPLPISVIANGAPAAPPARRKKPVVLFVLLLVVIVGIVVAAFYAVHASHFESTDDAYIEGHVITISPQVSALVKAVLIDDNKIVHKGDVLVQLDPTDLPGGAGPGAGHAGSHGRKSSAGKRVRLNPPPPAGTKPRPRWKLPAPMPPMQVADYKRFMDLSKQNPGAVSKQQMDLRLSPPRQSNVAQVKQAEAKLRQADAEITTKKATAIAADGDLKKAIADVHQSPE